MVHTKWVAEDGYYETLISFEQGTGAVLIARAVLDSKYQLEPVVRDFKTGKMLASGQATRTISFAKERALELAQSVLKSSATEIKEWIV